MQLFLQSLKKSIGEAALFAGSATVLFAVAGASSTALPGYSTFYYAAASGLSLIVGALIVLAGELSQNV